MGDLKSKTLVNGKFHVLDKISAGGYGTVYQAVDMQSNTLVALKAEVDKNNDQLANEITIYKKMLQKVTANSPNRPIISLVAYGQDPILDVYYVVLPICGPDLRALVKQTPHGRFTMYTSLWFTLEAMHILEFLHFKCKIIHRDIKPSNFIIGVDSSGSRDLRIIDFGLSSTAKDGKAKNKFMGTLRYSSLNATDGSHVYFSDDLWALYYSTCENINGALPWRKTKDRETLNGMKRQIYDKVYSSRSVKNPWFDSHIEPESLFVIQRDLVNNVTSPNKYVHYKKLLASDLRKMERGHGVLKLDWELKTE